MHKTIYNAAKAEESSGFPIPLRKGPSIWNITPLISIIALVMFSCSSFREDNSLASKRKAPLFWWKSCFKIFLTFATTTKQSQKSKTGHCSCRSVQLDLIRSKPTISLKLF